jgi:hypothetical protein
MTKEYLIEVREIVQDTLEIGRIQIRAIQPLGLVATMLKVGGKPASVARIHGFCPTSAP